MASPEPQPFARSPLGFAKLPAPYARFVLPFFLSVVMTCVISGVSSAGGVISPTERNAERVECGAGSRPASLGMRVISGGVISRGAGSQPASLGMRRTTGTIWLLMT